MFICISQVEKLRQRVSINIEGNAACVWDQDLNAGSETPELKS